MKNYYRFQMILQKNGQALVGEDQDFGGRSALEHRIAKASWAGEKPYTFDRINNTTGQSKQAQVNSRFLGAGSFKTVFETPLRAGHPMPPTPISFVLAKLELDSANADKNKLELSFALYDFLYGMLFYGQKRTSLYYQKIFDPISALQGRGGVKEKLYLYLPRFKGKALDELIAQDTMDTNERIFYFTRLCNEVRAVHFAGFFHGDLKPGNIMADPVEGPALIDFGGVKCCWRYYGSHTTPYDITSKVYLQKFAGIFERSGRSMIQWPMVRDSINQASEFMASQLDTLKSEKDKRYKRLEDHKKNLLIWGAAYDTAALLMIAIELKLWTDDTELFFKRLIASNFNPGYLIPILEVLKGKYTGATALNVSPKISGKIEADNIEVVASQEPGIEPSHVATVIRERYTTQNQANQQGDLLIDDQQEACNRALKAVDDSHTLFRAFSAIREIYKQSSLDSNRAVDTKMLALTGLINALTFAHSPTDLTDLITKIFAVSLINRKAITKSRTASFGLLFNVVRRPELLPIIQSYFDPSLSQNTTETEFHETVLTSVSGLMLLGTGDPLRQDDYRKANRYRTLQKLFDSNTQSEVSRPITREQAKQLAGAISSSSSQQLQQLAKTNPMLASYVTALNTKKSEPEKDTMEEYRSLLVLQIKNTFNTVCGNTRLAQESDFYSDIREYYTAPQP